MKYKPKVGDVVVAIGIVKKTFKSSDELIEIHWHGENHSDVAWVRTLKKATPEIIDKLIPKEDPKACDSCSCRMDEWVD